MAPSSSAIRIRTPARPFQSMLCRSSSPINLKPGLEPSPPWCPRAALLRMPELRLDHGRDGNEPWDRRPHWADRLGSVASGAVDGADSLGWAQLWSTL